MLLPHVRYAYSRKNLVDWVLQKLNKIQFTTVLDVIGKNAMISYGLKSSGKEVTFNDLYKYNYYVGKAFIENSSAKLISTNNLTSVDKSKIYASFIYDTYKGMYFTDDENKWIDTVVQNIALLPNEYERSIAYYSLTQSCLSKRPFGGNFHNLGLHFRMEYKNNPKETYHTCSFEYYFNKYIKDANSKIFSNGKENKALNLVYQDLPEKFDLVFIDPLTLPYSRHRFDIFNTTYHFLEGIVNYSKWPTNMNLNLASKPYVVATNPWFTKDLKATFNDAFLKFKNNKIAVLMDDNLYTSWIEVKDILLKYKTNVKVFLSPFRSTGSKSPQNIRSYLLIGI